MKKEADKENADAHDPEEDAASQLDFEPEDELGAAASFKAKIDKLKAELAECKAERQQYLDGWQRAKADAVNVRREASEQYSRAGEREREKLFLSILPAIDSFEMAMADSSWDSVPKEWRAGVESIYTQLVDGLKACGIEAYGKVGEQFDPALHRAIQETEAGGSSGQITQVVRRGWRAEARVLRPADVVVVQ